MGGWVSCDCVGFAFGRSIFVLFGMATPAPPSPAAPEGPDALSAPMRGRVKLFSLERGYGFIKPDNGGADVYVTRVNVDKPKGLLRPGDLVTFRIRQKGQPQAVQVVRLNEDGTEDESCAYGWLALCAGWQRRRGAVVTVCSRLLAPLVGASA